MSEKLLRITKAHSAKTKRGFTWEVFEVSKQQSRTETRTESVYEMDYGEDLYRWQDKTVEETVYFFRSRLECQCGWVREGIEEGTTELARDHLRTKHDATERVSEKTTSQRRVRVGGFWGQSWSRWTREY